MDRDYSFGIIAMEIYFPKTYVSQIELEKFHKVDTGKYTDGLGQTDMAFACQFEDVNSMALTVVHNLLNKNQVDPQTVGKIQIGTQTLFDISKSTKTILMDLFKPNTDIQGATNVNACYGAMNAFLNAISWLTSNLWDRRYAIVVASDIAVYEKGSARATGGAGAVAILLGPNARITIDQTRASFSQNQYDFYKPNGNLQYPIFDGKLSIQCYMNSLLKCWQKLIQKSNYSINNINYFCFHSPYLKIVKKSFNKLLETNFQKLSEKQKNNIYLQKVYPSLLLSRRIGNIYTGSIFLNFYSLLLSFPNISDKKVCLFSYGSGLCSTILTLRVHKNILTSQNIEDINNRLSNRVKIAPQVYQKILMKGNKNYKRINNIQECILDDNVYYLSEIDYKYRRIYKLNNKNMAITKKIIVDTLNRFKQIKNTIQNQHHKFYQLSIQQRRNIVWNRFRQQISSQEFYQGFNGELDHNIADKMIQNVIGLISLPLGVVPLFVINEKQYVIPMAIQQPSVVAACSSIGKLLSPYSFYTSSTNNIMIGQIHIPKAQVNEIHKILLLKNEMIQQLNKQCPSMVKRGGGVTDIKIRQLNGINSRQYVVDLYIDVCDSMGANIVNTLSELAKKLLIQNGINTGIAILSNYCTERKSSSWFEIPVQEMHWKNVNGNMVTKQILQAYYFAKNDAYRAVTHNKGIMNGIDALCIATGQDWRAVQSAAHCYAARTGKYLPLSHFEVVTKEGVEYLKGSLQLPISVGVKGGAVSKNPIYQKTLQILGNPSAKQLSQIIVSIGLAQNFAALRALAIEGIQKGHMSLHKRSQKMDENILKQPQIVNTFESPPLPKPKL